MNTNDILVTAYPKSGITYLGFLLTAARLHHNHIRMMPTMYNIDYLLIDTHKMHGLPSPNMWKDGLGLFYKSHGGVCGAPNVIYLLRDPVATLKSYYDFKSKIEGPQDIKAFLSTEIPAWTHHVKSWLIDNNNASQSIFVTRYETLTSEPYQELQKIYYDAFGFFIDEDSLRFAVGRSNLQIMRLSESFFVARNPVNAKFDLNFVRKGDARDSKEFTGDIVDMIKERTRKTYEKALERLK